MELEGHVVDDSKKHGGIKATLFLYFLAVLRSSPNSANFSLVAYLHGTLHMGIVSSSSVITNLVGATSIFAVLVTFISDTYIKRSTAIFVFGPPVILGYMLLALQAHLPSLHPPVCDINKEPNNCEPVQGWNFILLYVSLCMFAFGEGCMRACIPSLGGDQFNSDDPRESRMKIRFFSWHAFADSLGVLIGLAFIVWIENNLGWNIGFSVCALVVLVGLLVGASGLPFYRNQKPNGSPMTRILQVLASASKKRQAVIPENIELQEIGGADSTGGEENSGTKIIGFLDKACIYNGDTSPWSFCSTTQVEETKAVLKMLPIFISCLLSFLPFTLLMTLTIQVGSTMDTKIGTAQISSASLIAIPAAFHMLMQPIYGPIITPLLSRLTGYEHGIAPLQRTGVGFVCGTAAACVAALVERERKKVAEEHGLMLFGTGVPMSVFWLVLQFFLLSVMDVASFGGLVELIKSEAPTRMKSIGPSVQFLLAGLATWSASLLIQLVNRATRHGEDGRGWLDGANFNRTHLDRFFWLLAAFEFMSLINYAFWARKCVSRHRPSSIASLDDQNSLECK